MLGVRPRSASLQLSWPGPDTSVSLPRTPPPLDGLMSLSASAERGKRLPISQPGPPAASAAFRPTAAAAFAAAGTSSLPWKKTRMVYCDGICTMKATRSSGVFPGGIQAS